MKCFLDFHMIHSYKPKPTSWIRIQYRIPWNDPYIFGPTSITGVQHTLRDDEAFCRRRSAGVAARTVSQEDLHGFLYCVPLKKISELEDREQLFLLPALPALYSNIKKYACVTMLLPGLRTFCPGRFFIQNNVRSIEFVNSITSAMVSGAFSLTLLKVYGEWSRRVCLQCLGTQKSTEVTFLIGSWWIWPHGIVLSWEIDDTESL